MQFRQLYHYNQTYVLLGLPSFLTFTPDALSFFVILVMGFLYAQSSNYDAPGSDHFAGAMGLFVVNGVATGSGSARPDG
jgi:hypothetical protein